MVKVASYAGIIYMIPWDILLIIKSECLIVHVILVRMGDVIIQLKFKSILVNGTVWSTHKSKTLFSYVCHCN